MQLDAWLRKQGLTQKQFAQQIGVDQSQVSRMCGAKPKWPSRALMRKVFVATGEKVGPVDFLFPQPQKKDARP